MGVYAASFPADDGQLLDADGHVVARLSLPEGDSLQAWNAHFANAALLVAAPDLLAALEAAEAYERGDPTPWGHDCNWCEDCAYRVVLMRQKAIAAARESTRQRMERARRRAASSDDDE